jgi:hypothetical protein
MNKAANDAEDTQPQPFRLGDPMLPGQCEAAAVPLALHGAGAVIRR